VSVIAYPVPVTPNGDGDDQSTVRAAGCKLLGVKVEMGTLTSMDVAITDEPSGAALLSLTGVAADGVYQPAVAMADSADGTALAGAFAIPVVFGRLQVAIANGDADETGEITLLVER
jgi:hypothetical protein